MSDTVVQKKMLLVSDAEMYKQKIDKLEAENLKLKNDQTRLATQVEHLTHLVSEQKRININNNGSNNPSNNNIKRNNININSNNNNNSNNNDNNSINGGNINLNSNHKNINNNNDVNSTNNDGSKDHLGISNPPSLTTNNTMASPTPMLTNNILSNAYSQANKSDHSSIPMMDSNVSTNDGVGSHGTIYNGSNDTISSHNSDKDKNKYKKYTNNNNNNNHLNNNHLNGNRHHNHNNNNYNIGTLIPSIETYNTSSIIHSQQINYTDLNYKYLNSNNIQHNNNNNNNKGYLRPVNMNNFVDPELVDIEQTNNIHHDINNINNNDDNNNIYNKHNKYRYNNTKLV